MTLVPTRKHLHKQRVRPVNILYGSPGFPVLSCSDTQGLHSLDTINISPATDKTTTAQKPPFSRNCSRVCLLLVTVTSPLIVWRAVLGTNVLAESNRQVAQDHKCSYLQYERIRKSTHKKTAVSVDHIKKKKKKNTTEQIVSQLGGFACKLCSVLQMIPTSPSRPNFRTCWLVEDAAVWAQVMFCK